MDDARLCSSCFCLRYVTIILSGKHFYLVYILGNERTQAVSETTFWINEFYIFFVLIVIER